VARTRDVIDAPTRRLHHFAIVTVALVALGQRAGAQRARSAPPRIQPEVRADFIDARATAAHVGVGFSVPASTYVRLGLVGAVGRAWADGESTTAGRVDALVRFVVDPLREFRWAPYGSGGVGGLYDGDGKWRAVLVGVLGIEGPQRGAIVPAIEVGFGGGLRVGVAVRRAIPGRR
jgi:hypothetical protein